MAKPYRDNVERLRAKFESEAIQVSALGAVDWRVDYLIGSSGRASLNVPSVHLSLQLEGVGNASEKDAPVSFEVDDGKFQILLNELKTARAMMDTLE